MSPTAAKPTPAQARVETLVRRTLVELELRGIPAILARGVRPVDRESGALEAVIATHAGKNLFLELLAKPVRRAQHEVHRLRRFKHAGYVCLELEDETQLVDALKKHFDR